MDDDSTAENPSTVAGVVAHNKRVFWWAVAGAALVLILWKVPQWQVAHVQGLKPTEQFDRENEARKTLAQILGGTVLLAGGFATWRNLKLTQQSLKLTQQSQLIMEQGQITDRFTKAIEQLGAVYPDGKTKKLEVRLGGIYALERIANDSERDHWPIVEVLCTYVRGNARVKPHGVSKQSHPDADIQAILTVLGRRNRSYEKPDQRLDLARTDLSGANLSEANLSGAHFLKANLSGAYFLKANLSGAYFPKANLSGAFLGKANLSGAYFGEANLSGAYLNEADLSKARIVLTDLREARGLTQEQIDKAEIDKYIKLPAELHMPES
jgi:hypothetical protein